MAQEREVWSQLGVDRLNTEEFLVRPSGSLNAPLALHMLNPTFYSTDPYGHETFDPSNPTLHLIERQGFSPKNSFIFDQFCRRARTDDCLYYWSKELQKPHDDFVSDLRDHMLAIVEICWGEIVSNKSQNSSGSWELIRFPLWGRYRDVKLFLEIEKESQTIRRFVFHVRHPQYFCRPKRLVHKANPKEEALIQDYALQLAAKLANVEIKNDFYRNHTKGQYHRLTAHEKERLSLLEGVSRSELKIAFPERFRARKACGSIQPKVDQGSLEEFQQTLEELKTEKSLAQAAELESNQSETEKRHKARDMKKLFCWHKGLTE